MTISNEQIPPVEKRNHVRRSYLKLVTIHSGHRTTSGIIQNISDGGLYIETSKSFSIGQKITISYLPSDNTDEIEIQGEVVWTDHGGFAMEYIYIVH